MRNKIRFDLEMDAISSEMETNDDGRNHFYLYYSTIEKHLSFCDSNRFK